MAQVSEAWGRPGANAGRSGGVERSGADVHQREEKWQRREHWCGINEEVREEGATMRREWGRRADDAMRVGERQRTAKAQLKGEVQWEWGKGRDERKRWME